MNRNLTGGYYIVSLGDVELLGESVSLPDVAKLLYEAKKYKFVVFQDIVIGGNKKVATPAMFDASMAYTTEPEDWDEETDGEFAPEPIYTATIYNVYGKNITIDAEGGASVTDYEVQIDTDSLYGKFVRIINASDIDPDALTDEQIEIFKEGVFVNGSFLGSKNPVFLPAEDVYINYIGGVMFFTNVENVPVSPNYGYRDVKLYRIDLTNKKIYIDPGFNFSVNQWNKQVSLQSASFSVENLLITNLNTKTFPTYPTDQTDKTYVLKLVNGTLTWVEETA